MVKIKYVVDYDNKKWEYCNQINIGNCNTGVINDIIKQTKKMPIPWVGDMEKSTNIFDFTIYDYITRRGFRSWGEYYSFLISPRSLTWSMLLRHYTNLDYIKHILIVIFIEPLKICNISPTHHYKMMVKIRRRIKYNRLIQYDCKGCGRREVGCNKFQRCKMCHNNDERYCSQECYYISHKCAQDYVESVIRLKYRVIVNDNTNIDILVKNGSFKVITKLPKLEN